MKKNDEVGTKDETTTTIDKETKNLFLLHKKEKECFCYQEKSTRSAKNRS